MNITPALEQFIEEVKRARLRAIQKYEMKSELHSRILPIIFIGSSAFVLVSTIVGFHFSAGLQLPVILFLNFVLLPAILFILLHDLQLTSPGI